jgi:hypothetical protein
MMIMEPGGAHPRSSLCQQFLAGAVEAGGTKIPLNLEGTRSRLVRYHPFGLIHNKIKMDLFTTDVRSKGKISKKMNHRSDNNRRR